MTSHSDADVLGFRRADIYDFLDGHGLTLSREAHAPSANESDPARPKDPVIPQNSPQQSANGFGERFTFSEIAAAKRAEFISYREAMKKLRESTGDALKDVAVGLKSHGIHGKHVAYLAGPEQAVRRLTGAEDLTALLDETIDNGGITPAWVGPDEQADPERCGWIRSEFVTALRDANLPCPDTLLNAVDPLSPTSSATSAQLDWVSPYIGLHQISLGHAAALLAGLHPDTRYLYSDEEREEIAPWRAALIDAADNSEIDGSGSWRVDKVDRQRMLSHSDIRAWCAKRGHVWPIPNPNPLPVAAPELFERLQEAETERDLLTQKKDALAQEALAFRREIDELRDVIADRDASSIALEERLRRAISDRDEQMVALQEGLDAAKAALDTMPPQSVSGGDNASESGTLTECIDLLTTELASAFQEVERLNALVPPQPTWLMEKTTAVQRRYWGDNWKADDRDTWASQADILEWIKQTYVGLSEAQRKAVELVACPVNRNPATKKYS